MWFVFMLVGGIVMIIAVPGFAFAAVLTLIVPRWRSRFRRFAVGTIASIAFVIVFIVVSIVNVDAINAETAARTEQRRIDAEVARIAKIEAEKQKQIAAAETAKAKAAERAKAEAEAAQIAAKEGTAEAATDYRYKVAAWIAKSEDAVKARLKDPSSAEFRNVTAHRYADMTAPVVCGEVNARNDFGGYTGMQPFIAMGDGPVPPILASDMAEGEFVKTWNTLCTGPRVDG